MGIIHHFGILFKIANKTTTMKTAPFKDFELFSTHTHKKKTKKKNTRIKGSSTSFSKIGML